MKLTANGHDWYPLGLDYDEDRDPRPRWRCVGCHFVSEWDDVDGDCPALALDVTA